MTADAIPTNIPEGKLVGRVIAMPADTNPEGDIFGGWLLAQMDLAGSTPAFDIAQGRCATVAVDAMVFHQPVSVGDEVSIYACVDRIGRTSIRVPCRGLEASAGPTRHRAGDRGRVHLCRHRPGPQTEAAAGTGMTAPPEVLILQGSARATGGTAAAVDALRRGLGPMTSEIVDLAALNLAPFGYDRSEAGDGFVALAQRMTASAHLVFATPVYWYAMSGVMKTVFDRLTDLLLDPERRPIGRSLAGRKVWVLAVGTDPALPSGFAEPFALTARYFDMEPRDTAYVQSIGSDLPTETALKTAERLGARIRASP